MDKLGKYEILDKIGEGGFGVVYKGKDPFIQRLVAIKTCSSNDEDIRKRFFREAQIAGNLHHPNIVTIHDFGVENETPFLVQEFLLGSDLDELMHDEHVPLTLPRKVDFLIGVAEGLAFAHGQGVIHRDIKPANIRILPDDTVKVMDFGIAKLKDQESGLTATGVTVGTIAYLSPEQLNADKLDHRADIFSYGVMAYELLADKRPFDGKTFSAICFQILSKDPDPLSEIIAISCPPGLSEIVSKCLAKKPEDRYTAFDDVIVELRAVREALSDWATSDEQNESAVSTISGDETKQLAALQDHADRTQRALEAGNLTAAEVNLATLRRDFANVPGVNEIAEGLAQQLEQQRASASDSARQAAQQQADAFVTKAEEFRAAGDFVRAEDQLAKALQVMAEHSGALRLLDTVRAEKETAKREEELLQAIYQRTEAISASISAGELDRAQEDLEGAKRELGTSTSFERLERELGQAREAAADQLVAKGHEALAAGRLDEATGIAVEALAILPTHQAATKLRADVEAAVAKSRQVSDQTVLTEVPTLEPDAPPSDATIMAPSAIAPTPAPPKEAKQQPTPPAPTPTPAKAPPPKKQQKKKAKEKQPTPKPQPKPAPAPAPAKPAPQPAAKKPEMPKAAPSIKPGDDGKPWLLIGGGIAAVVIVAIVGVVALSGGGDEGGPDVATTSVEPRATTSASATTTVESTDPQATSSTVTTAASTTTIDSSQTETVATSAATSSVRATTSVREVAVTPTTALTTVPTSSVASTTTTSAAPTTTTVAGPSPDEQAIQSTLSAYSSAWAALDADAINAVHATAGLSSRDMRNFRAATITISGCNLSINGNAATARCNVQREITPRAGATQTATGAGFRLEKRGGRWVIVGLL